MSCITKALLEPARSLPAIRPASSANSTTESESGLFSIRLRFEGALPYVGAEPVPLKFWDGVFVALTVVRKPLNERKTGRRSGREAAMG